MAETLEEDWSRASGPRAGARDRALLLQYGTTTNGRMSAVVRVAIHSPSVTRERAASAPGVNPGTSRDSGGKAASVRKRDGSLDLRETRMQSSNKHRSNKTTSSNGTEFARGDQSP
ncbi:hypothetical protein GN956_G24352 [Arapaima gigas]